MPATSSVPAEAPCTGTPLDMVLGPATGTDCTGGQGSEPGEGTGPGDENSGDYNDSRDGQPPQADPTEGADEKDLEDNYVPCSEENPCT